MNERNSYENISNWITSNYDYGKIESSMVIDPIKLVIFFEERKKNIKTSARD